MPVRVSGKLDLWSRANCGIFLGLEGRQKLGHREEYDWINMRLVSTILLTLRKEWICDPAKWYKKECTGRQFINGAFCELATCSVKAMFTDQIAPWLAD